MNTTTLAPPPARTAQFPILAVETKLREELIETIKAEATIRGITLPSSPVQISQAAVHVDSLVVVSILCAIEPILGFELSESVVRAGGYGTVEAALGHLLPRLENEWVKKKGTRP